MATGDPWVFQKQREAEPVLVIEPDQENSTVFYCAGEEILRITDKGFWVKGERVPADAKEAEAVYESFKQWLTWHQLTRE